jgi:uncharacterized oxidoreductase
MGKARVARLKGEQVPPGTMLDGEGRVTRDPGGMFKRPREGALIAFGDHKGSGLAIMCELLGAALVGGITLAPKWERDGSAINSMLSIVIDPDALTSRQTLASEAAAFLDYLRSSALREGFDEVLVPGEPEQRARQNRAAAVPVDAGTLSELRTAGEKAGLATETVAELLG